MLRQITPISYFGQREALIDDLWLLLGDKKFKQFHDLFGGCGSLSFAAMREDKAQKYIYNDSLPMLKFLWDEIKNSASLLINHYTSLAKTLKNTTDDRASFYASVLAHFNGESSDTRFKQYSQPLLFAFLINFAKDNMPIYDDNKVLATTISPCLTNNEIVEQSEQFRCRAIDLSTMLAQHNFTAKSGDFNDHLDDITADDIVVLDPPYPQQTRDIYYNINNEDELFTNLTTALQRLAEKNIPVVMFYGANNVLLKNQFNADNTNLQHLIRLAHHPLFGDYLEHAYLSHDLFKSLDKLPAHIMTYESSFDTAKEMTDKDCEAAIRRLQNSVEMPETPYL